MNNFSEFLQNLIRRIFTKISNLAPNLKLKKIKLNQNNENLNKIINFYNFYYFSKFFQNLIRRIFPQIWRQSFWKIRNQFSRWSESNEIYSLKRVGPAEPENDFEKIQKSKSRAQGWTFFAGVLFPSCRNRTKNKRNPMEKNGILLERFPIGSQKATKVKKKKPWKKPIIRHFVSATTSSDHLHFVHSWWLLTETRPSKAKKKSRMRDLSVAATAVSFTLLPHFFFGWPLVPHVLAFDLQRSQLAPHSPIGAASSPKFISALSLPHIRLRPWPTCSAPSTLLGQ